MSADEHDFIINTLRVCQDIQNRFYLERIKVGAVEPEEPWQLSRVSLVARNAEPFLEKRVEKTNWPKDFGESIDD